MKIVKKRFCDWDDKTKKRLKSSTLEGGWLIRFIKTFPESLTIVAFGEKQLLGWAFALLHKEEISLSIFVNKRYRRRGVATHLVEEAIKIFPQIRLACWDKKTKNLFLSLQKEYPKKIIVYSWWKEVEKYRKLVDSRLL